MTGRPIKMYQSAFDIRIKLAAVPSSENSPSNIIMMVLKASIPKIVYKTMDITFAASDEMICVQSDKTNLTHTFY